jgi:hypothetical protein
MFMQKLSELLDSEELVMLLLRELKVHHSSLSHSFVSTLFRGLSRFLKGIQRNVVYHLGFADQVPKRVQVVYIVEIFAQLKQS